MDQYVIECSGTRGFRIPETSVPMVPGLDGVCACVNTRVCVCVCRTEWVDGKGESGPRSVKDLPGVIVYENNIESSVKER